MPRKSRVDAPGALHHIIVRGIERARIFSTLEIIFCAFLSLKGVLKRVAENYFVKVLTPLKGVLKRVPFIGVRNDTDRNDFLERLGKLVTETKSGCFAWALLSNHFHLLVKTGRVPVSTLMRRLLTGYAVSFNRRHRRSGVPKLFGDRTGTARRRYKVFVEKGALEGRRPDSASPAVKYYKR